MTVPVLDSHENVFLAGWLREPADFVGVTNLVPVGASDILVAKFSSDGDLLWVRQSGGTGADWARSGASDAFGNCFVGGLFTQSATFGDFTLNNQVTTQYVCVVKYDSNGTVLWARQACQGQYEVSVTADREGNCYLAAQMPSGEVFYGKYDPDGTLAWSRSSPPLDVLWLQADAIGACYVAGNFGYYFTGNFGY